MIERSVNFERTRRMRCGSCGHEWSVSGDWLDQFEQAEAGCPVCRTDSSSENRPEFCANPDDPVFEDSAVLEFSWYHSSTHQNWPDRNFDPAAGLTEETKRRMESLGSGVGAVERWAERQKAKALHVGTYEAAVENMFRRMADQAGAFEQFYLHRVQLDPDSVIEPGVHHEPTDWIGDAYLAEVCLPGTNVLRYVNVREDQSSVSLAIEPSAVRAVQRIPIPLTTDAADPWVASATQRLLAAASRPFPKADPSGRRPRHEVSALRSEARVLELEVAECLPTRIRRRFSAGFSDEGFAEVPSAFPMKLLGLARLVTNPQETIALLGAQRWHLLN